MSVKISIPDEAFEQARQIAEARQVSVEEVISSALADQAVAWERLRQRAACGDRGKYLAALAKVPDQKPTAGDEL